MDTTRYTLPKRERLHLKRDLDLLFGQGRSFVSYPLRVIYLVSREPQDERVQMMVSVGKKYFRRAVKRNRVKRLIRESYRLNKHSWLVELKEQRVWIKIGYICVSKDLPSFGEVERAVVKSFKHIISKLEHQESVFLEKIL